MADESRQHIAAEQAAISWLTLVDAEDYAQSWREAAGLFRAALSAEAWAEEVRQVRGLLGALRSRELVRMMSASRVPEAPDGEYVIIEFQATFDHSVAEVVTPMLEEDGVWRVVGYYIR